MNQTDRVRSYFDELAPSYDEQIRFFERVFIGDGRQWACSHAVGDVLEVAIGTGRNLAFYSKGVHLTGVDFSPAMLEIARQRASAMGRPVELQVGDAGALPLPNDRFDTVVCTLSLCCIPDDRKALAEMRRVLRPGGRLVLLDHVASDVGAVRAIQRVL